MERYVLSLPDLVQWGLLVGILVLILGPIFAALSCRKQKRKLRKRRRKCAQCGILEEIARGESKFGTCQVCGGVTSRGRSRKLG